MHFTLRELTPDDAETFAKHANNINIAKQMTDQFAHPYTQEDAIAFINKVNSDQTSQVFTIDIDGVPCGGIGLHALPDVYRKNMELGYWLAEPFWGKGITTTAINQMVEYGFNHCDIKRIFARPNGENLASQRVLEKAGFSLEARLKDAFYKNGQYLDELIYSVRKS